MTNYHREIINKIKIWKIFWIDYPYLVVKIAVLMCVSYKGLLSYAVIHMTICKVFKGMYGIAFWNMTAWFSIYSLFFWEHVSLNILMGWRDFVN